jgi:hypothetical protein
MDNAAKIKVKNLIHSIGLKYNLRDIEVLEIIESQFRFAQEEIKNLDFKKEDIKTNFIYKYIGKLYIDTKTINKLKEEYGE